ncbi:hypothetical protein [Neisseria perflava]|nr:hypothetical protein [Neisseria perflava]MCP1659239.1 hypothetical protein [Neisseria perflava]MCP1771719.1 hypothetical protein [Neisseria perflava]
MGQALKLAFTYVNAAVRAAYRSLQKSAENGKTYTRPPKGIAVARQLSR